MTLPNPLGPYQIERQLGEGGCATVYLAFDRRRSHRVALKVLRPEHARGEFLRRFQREGQQMLSLRHQHIVSAYDAGQSQGYHYIAMPYLAGGSLADLIRQRGRLDLQTAARVIEQVASALDFVHPNIIHRDLKANNILLDGQGTALVADFGVAHVADAAALTATGEQPGTAVCMAPEQIRPSIGHTSPATDVWALGVMLYHMLTGRLPFQHEDPLGVMFQIINEQPVRVTAINRDVPPDIDTLIARALEKDPRQRYQSAGVLARDLRSIAGPAPVEVRAPDAASAPLLTPVTPRRPRPSAWRFPLKDKLSGSELRFAAGALACLLLLIIIAGALSLSSPARPTEAVVMRAKATNMVSAALVTVAATLTHPEATPLPVSQPGSTRHAPREAAATPHSLRPTARTAKLAVPSATLTATASLTATRRAPTATRPAPTATATRRLPTATPARSVFPVRSLEPGWRSATLRDQQGQAGATWLYGQRSAETGRRQLTLDGSLPVAVAPLPLSGDSTEVTPPEGTGPNNLWFLVMVGDAEIGYVPCPYVFFLDTKEWAECRVASGPATVTALVVPKAEVSGLQPGWLRARLRDPQRLAQFTYLYAQRSGDAAGGELQLGDSLQVAVAPIPLEGGSTGVTVPGSTRDSYLWHLVIVGQKEIGYVPCPYVYFLDTNQWAQCDH